ncbi:T9SS type A sorting domain-containing protein [Flavobacteriales bacterium]|nr:T9SS type A sorting domain-containing protein [Flavobacteriales bacterium]
MKKYYLLLFTALASFTGMAQKTVPSHLASPQQIDASLIDLSNLRTPEKLTNNNLLKSTFCEDTSYYPAFKASAFQAYWVLVNDDWNGFSQTYHNTNNLEVIGVYHLTYTDFDGVAGSVPDVPVTFMVHNTGLYYSNDPLDTIASESGFVTDNGGDWQAHMFANPIPVTDTFAVSMTLDASAPLSDTLYPISNADGDGLLEDLSHVYYSPYWYSLLNDLTNPANHDFLILPIVRQKVSAGFTLSDSCLAVNQVTTITDTSSIQSATEDMFNLAAWWGGTNDAWVMGEGTVGDTIYGNPGTFSYAAPGSYTITLHDTLWLMNQYTYCAESYSQTVSVGLDASTTVVDALCNGDDGTVTLAGTGGDSPYTYSDDNTTYVSTAAFSVAAGTATYYVEDGVGCIASASGTVAQPTALTIALDAANNPTGCTLTNGSILITPTGGTPGTGYTFLWDDTTPTITEDISSIGAGSYNVVVTDANNCTATTSASLADPNSPTITVDLATNLTCYDDGTGAIATTIAGGTGTLTIDWNSGMAATEDLTGLSAGSYSLSVVDLANCSNAAIVTLTQPDSLELTIAYTPIGCNGDSTDIDIEVVGGVATYTYDWDNDGYDDAEDSTGNVAGTYTVMVMDASGCLIDSTFAITEPTAALGLTITYTAELDCNGGSTDIDVEVTGGTAAYMYDWDADGYDDTQDSTMAGAGTYTVMVMDASGCLFDSTFAITEPTALMLTGTGTDEMMGADGEVDLTVSGGTPGYGYAWDNSSTDEDLTGLDAGTYFVTVTDANACTDTLSVTIGTQVGVLENGASALVYPNPTNGIVTVEFTQMLDGTIAVLDAIGQLVSSQRVSSLVQTIDLSSNAKGVYFLQISKGESNSVVKVVLD